MISFTSFKHRSCLGHVHGAVGLTRRDAEVLGSCSVSWYCIAKRQSDQNCVFVCVFHLCPTETHTHVHEQAYSNARGFCNYAYYICITTCVTCMHDVCPLSRFLIGYIQKH